MGKDVLILGNGGWGTATGVLLCRNGHRVTVWCKFPEDIREMREKRENVKFLRGVKLPEEMRFVGGAELDIASFDLIVMAIPTQFIRGSLTEMRRLFPPRVPILSLAKGIENATGLTPSGIVCEVLENPRVGVLSGPSHAEEVARFLPTSVVVASKHPRFAKSIQSMFNCDTFRVYTSADVVGVELGGALKNIFALAAGICDGLKLGDNAKSALLSRSVVEMSRVGIAMGARQKKTFFGLSGIGDLITTSFSPHGRNLFVGREIGKGRTLDKILKEMIQVAEGVWTTKAVVEKLKPAGIEAPIAEEVYQILFKKKDPMVAVTQLMRRIPRNED